MNYDALMVVRDSDPGIKLGDKGYEATRSDRTRAIAAPCRSSRPSGTVTFNKASAVPCALRSRIECFINRLKNSRRVATRYDQTADSFLDFAALSSIRLWIRFVHAT